MSLSSLLSLWPTALQSVLELVVFHIGTLIAVAMYVGNRYAIIKYASLVHCARRFVPTLHVRSQV